MKKEWLHNKNKGSCPFRPDKSAKVCYDSFLWNSRIVILRVNLWKLCPAVSTMLLGEMGRFLALWFTNFCFDWDWEAAITFSIIDRREFPAGKLSNCFSLFLWTSVSISDQDYHSLSGGFYWVFLTLDLITLPSVANWISVYFLVSMYEWTMSERWILRVSLWEKQLCVPLYKRIQRKNLPNR